MLGGGGKCKILFIEATRNGVVGGSLVCLYRLIRELYKKGYEVSIVLRSDFPILGDLEKYCKVFIIPKCYRSHSIKSGRSSSKLRVLGRFLYDIVFDILPGIRSLRRIIIAEGVGIVHLNNGLGFDLDGILAAKLCNIPCVVHQRGIGRVSSVSRWIGRYVGAMVCVSDAVYQDILKQDIALSSIQIVYDGIDPDVDNSVGSMDECRSELGLQPGVPMVGLMGTIQPWKGQLEFIMAVAKVRDEIPDLQCVLAGGVYDLAYEKQLKDLVHAKGLGGNIRFMDYRKDVAKVMNALDVVVHASLRPEPFGMVLIEAMSLGKPVVAARAGGPLEIVEDQVTGILFAPGDTDAMADAMARLLRDPALASAIGRSARKRVLQSFPEARTVKQIEKLYTDLIGGDRNGFESN